MEPLRHLRAAFRHFFRRATATSRIEEAVALIAIIRARCDVVYVNSVKSACYVRPAMWLRKKVVLHVHEVEPLASTTLRRYRLHKYYDRITLIACSDAARSNLARIARVREEQIVVAESSIDIHRVVELSREGTPAHLRCGAEELVVGACGVANKGKGVDLWLAAVKRLSSDPEIPPTRFVWIGARAADGTALAHQFGLDGAVEFCGELENPYGWIRRMDVFTLPSRTDASPLVVLEAMALGCAVVAFDVGGVSGQLGDAGVLVPPEDVHAFSDRIGHLLKDPTKRHHLGTAARERARQRSDLQRFNKTIVRSVSASPRRHTLKP